VSGSLAERSISSDPLHARIDALAARVRALRPTVTPP
jgi:hypothetical protein